MRLPKEEDEALDGVMSSKSSKPSMAALVIEEEPMGDELDDDEDMEDDDDFDDDEDPVAALDSIESGLAKLRAMFPAV